MIGLTGLKCTPNAFFHLLYFDGAHFKCNKYSVSVFSSHIKMINDLSGSNSFAAIKIFSKHSVAKIMK